MLSFVSGKIFYNLLDDGIANLLGVETLRHGTNAINYIRIRAAGGDPNYGGSINGSTVNWHHDNTHNYFYVFKDSELKKIKYRNFLDMPMIISRTYPCVHSFLSGYNFTVKLLPPSKMLKVVFGIFSGVITLFIVPTLRFRFEKIDAERLEDDPIYAGAAYRTAQKVEAWRIGPIGSFCTGINSNWFSRVKVNPIKVLTGIIQLIAATAIVVIGVGIIATNSAVILPFSIGILLG